MVLRLEVKKNQNFDGHNSTEILTVVVVQKCKSTKSWTLQVKFNQNLPFIHPPYIWSENKMYMYFSEKNQLYNYMYVLLYVIDYWVIVEWEEH